ncbi:cell wall-binding repeat-containing protein [Clostridium sp. JS66]|uniref:cell wall-binding repeat-containing protein n=1 Tax=Clostridium sp. JS66 TaxID=3064705 RepID=UPI00298EC6BD|nr:cell wall-binding repeat-containing protein [Clostridium sp. JS66]WPC42240.1 cell wall-binding repeat-containing protein [Clostridium sp. JS66]
MSKKSTKALASATLMSLVLTTALSAGPVQAAPGKVTRTSGVDRYATAASVATTNWTTSPDVVLVSGEGYADAVSASALAKKLNAPILLTSRDQLNSDTQTALNQLKPKNIYVVGGNGSISSGVRDLLKKNNYNLIELGGVNRYETNAKVAQKLVDLGVKADEVMMVGGEGFSDALSVAPIAAAKGQILLLGMNNADYMQPVIDFVNNNKSKVTVIGTENVINSSIYNKVNATNRVNGGSDRFDTNMKVLTAYKDTVKLDKMYVANATGDGYADALVASAVAGKTGSPLILVDTDGSEGTTNAIKYIKANATKDKTDMNVIGGTGVVSANVEEQINKAIGDTPPSPVGDVESIDPVGLNGIKIVFGTDVDEDSAEEVSNYKVDGEQLTDKTAKAVLEDDNRTVFITLADAKKQSKEYEVTVKKGVITADGTNTIPSLDKPVTFTDTKAPTLKSVKASGQNKLTVEFTAPLDMKTISTLASKFRIKDQNITSFGLDTSNIPNTTTPLSEIKDSIKSTDGVHTWARKAEFYFDTKLPAGSNTLKVLEGDTDGVLTDAGGFSVKEETQDFNVDTKDGVLTVKDITAKCDPDGTLWVKFGREMDKKTALNASNYVLNNSSDTLQNLGATLKLKENDNTVKITGISSKINTGANNIFIDDSVRDAYGNAVDDDTRVNFTKEKDETKPTVLDAKIEDSETIRLRFSKDIDATYAIHSNNYVLKDSTGLDITSHIKEIKPSTGVKKSDGSWDDSKTWDIKMYKNPAEKGGSTDSTTDWRLTGSKYSLTIKNLADTTSNKNMMDPWDTQLTGTDDVAPKVTAVYAKSQTSTDSDWKQKVVVYFSEAMDVSTFTRDNFKYSNKSGDSKDLPSSADITHSDDNKSVTIKFPTNYAMNDSTKDDDNDVTGIIADGVKDEAGNKIDSFKNKGAIVAANGTIKLKDNCYRMVYDGDDILVKVQYDGSIDSNNTDKNDFKVAGETPDSLSIDKSDLVLRFGKDSIATSVSSYTALPGYALNPTSKAANDKPKKVDVLKYYAPDTAKFEVVTDTPVTRDIAGNKIAKESVAGVYDNSVAPKTTKDYWYATTPQMVNGVKEAAVVVTFDSKLYDNSGVVPDDFAFTVSGKTVKPAGVKVVNNNLVFLFKVNSDVSESDLNSFTSGTDVSVKLINANVVIKSVADGDGHYAQYKPSDKDKSDNRTATVSSTIDLNKLLTASSTPTPTPSGDVVAHTTTVKPSLDTGKKTMVIVTLANASDDGKYDIFYNGTKLTRLDAGVYSIDVTDDVTQAQADAKITSKAITPVTTAVAHTTSVKASLDTGKKTMINVVLTNASDDGKYDIFYNGTKLTRLDAGIYSIDVTDDVTQAQADAKITFSAVK